MIESILAQSSSSNDSSSEDEDVEKTQQKTWSLEDWEKCMADVIPPEQRASALLRPYLEFHKLVNRQPTAVEDVPDVSEADPDFVIDTSPANDTDNKGSSDAAALPNAVPLPGPSECQRLLLPSKLRLRSRISTGIDMQSELYFDPDDPSTSDLLSADDTLAAKTGKLDEVLKNCILGPDFDALETVPNFYKSKGEAKKERKTAADSTAGSSWFNMPAPEETPESARDVEALRLRSVIDPLRFYRREERMGAEAPQFYQMGRVADSASDFYSSRMPRKDRKRTLADEVLHEQRVYGDTTKMTKRFDEAKSAVGRKHTKGKRRTGK